MAIQLVVDETDNALTAAQATSLLERYMPVGKLPRLSEREREVISRLQILAEGRTYIDQRRTIEAGGFDEMGRPKLAACHPLCEGRLRINTSRAKRWRVMELACCKKFCFWDKGEYLPRLTFRERLDGNWPGEGIVNWYAQTPMIPAEYRPADLVAEPETYLLIFEAIWGKISAAPKPAPVDLDPILLRFDGHGWVVEAVWDLTEVEAQALAGGVLSP